MDKLIKLYVTTFVDKTCGVTKITDAEDNIICEYDIKKGRTDFSPLLDTGYHPARFIKSIINENGDMEYSDEFIVVKIDRGLYGNVICIDFGQDEKTFDLNEYIKNKSKLKHK